MAIRRPLRYLHVGKPSSSNTVSTIKRSFLLYASSRTGATTCTSLGLIFGYNGSSKPSRTSLIQVSDSGDCTRRSRAKYSLQSCILSTLLAPSNCSFVCGFMGSNLRLLHTMRRAHVLSRTRCTTNCSWCALASLIF